MDAVEVDLEALQTALEIQRATQNVSWRDVATQTGMSASTFSRLRTGKGIDIHGYAACCRWLGVSLDTFVTPTDQPNLVPGQTTDLLTLLRRRGVPQVYWAPLVAMIQELAKIRPE